MNRRALFGGLLGILAAPAVIRTPGLLMPVQVVRPMFTLGDWTKMLEAQRLINQRHSAMLTAFPPSLYEDPGILGEWSKDIVQQMRGCNAAVAKFNNRNPMMDYITRA